MPSLKRSEIYGAARKTTGRFLNLAYMLFAVIVLFSALSMCREAMEKNQFFVSTEDGHTMVQSYVPSFVAGKITLFDHRQRPYAEDVQLEWTNKVIEPYHVNRVMIGQFVPYFYDLMAPFAMLTLEQSFIAWCALSFTFALWGLALVLTKERGFSILASVAFMLGAFVSFPSLLNLRYGQVAWFLLGAASLYYYFWIKGKDFLSGFFLALISLKPNYAVYMAIPALAQRRWKIILAGFLTEVVLLVISGLSLGWQVVLDYPKNLYYVETSTRNFGVFPERMTCMRAVFARFVDIPTALALSNYLYFAVVIGLFFLWLHYAKRKPDDKQIQNWLMAITVLATLVFSPHTHVYDCILLALPAAITLPTVDLFSLPRQGRLSHYIWCAVFILFPIVISVGYVSLLSVSYASNLSMVAVNFVLILLAADYVRSLGKAEPLEITSKAS